MNELLAEGPRAQVILHRLALSFQCPLTVKLTAICPSPVILSYGNDSLHSSPHPSLCSSDKLGQSQTHQPLLLFPPQKQPLQRSARRESPPNNRGLDAPQVARGAGEEPSSVRNQPHREHGVIFANV